jgi:inosine/xanthosine triphosphate pyrophosphatase family protein
MPRGKNGDKNGWDPCFQPDGCTITLGEMNDKDRKKYCSRIGALYRASKVLRNIINQNLESKEKQQEKSSIELNN